MLKNLGHAPPLPSGFCNKGRSLKKMSTGLFELGPSIKHEVRDITRTVVFHWLQEMSSGNRTISWGEVWQPFSHSIFRCGCVIAGLGGRGYPFLSWIEMGICCHLTQNLPPSPSAPRAAPCARFPSTCSTSKQPASKPESFGGQLPRRLPGPSPPAPSQIVGVRAVQYFLPEARPKLERVSGKMVSK